MSQALRIASSPPDAGGAAPFNYFLHSHGPATGATLHLGWILAAICAAVCVLVAGLLGYAIWRRRPASERDVTGDPGRSLRWVGIGTAWSTVLLFGLAAYALTVLAEVGAPPRAAAFTVAVSAYDWWWRIDYGDGPQRFTSANELHIPVGVPVRVRLDSADVIHAFWVPELAGKTQMIPGVSNEQWLQADAPGLYRGECTQFCGAQHAHMAFDVVAQAPADFAAWRERQLRGSDARGEHGPDLTHLLGRRMLGAGLLSNTAAHRIAWVTQVQSYKPGARMPDMALSASERADLGAYLDTLQ